MIAIDTHTTRRLLLAGTFVAALGLVLTVFFWLRVEWFEKLDLTLQDSLVTLTVPPQPRVDFVFLGIDSATLSLGEDDPGVVGSSRPLTMMAEPFPQWSREVWALVTQRLMDAGARVVVFDLVFAGEREGDAEFRRVLETCGDRVVLGYSIEQLAQDKTADVVPFLRLPSSSLIGDPSPEDPRLGYVNLQTDDYGVIRDAVFTDLIENIAGSDIPSGRPPHKSLTAAVLNKMGESEKIPSTGERVRYLPMRNIDFAYPIQPLYGLFWPDIWERNFDSGAIFKDKVVMIGPAEQLFQDIHATPAGQMLGPHIHMNLMTSVLNGDLYRVAPESVNIPGTILAAFLAILPVIFLQRPALSVLVVLGLASVMLAGEFLMVEFFAFMIQPAPPILSILLVGIGCLGVDFTIERMQKGRLRRSLSQYVSPDFVNEILKNPTSYLNQLVGIRKTVAVLFSDVRGFTTLSEKLEPEALVAQLNEYLDAMVEEVFRERGIVDKFIGDAIMAVWGTLQDISVPEAAECSVRSALRMRVRLDELNVSWKAKGWPELDNGIGIHIGDAVTGNIGSERKKDLTVIGDAVNLAARLEGLTKPYGVGVMISGSVAEHVKDKFSLRLLDRVVVKGKSKPVDIYEVLPDDHAERLGISEEWVKIYQTACQGFFRRDFEAAATGFEKCLHDRSGDVASETLAGRCREYMVDPPPIDWDGSTVMKTK